MNTNTPNALGTTTAVVLSLLFPAGGTSAEPQPMAAAAAHAAAQAQAAAQAPLPPPPQYQVKRAAIAPVIDGKLDDAAWKTASPALPFVFPWADQTGAKQSTAVRLLWDEKNLYLAYNCEDTDINVRHTQRDDPTYEDDAVELFINPAGTRGNYYGLEMNARGVLYDYFYAHPQVLLKRFDLVGQQLATQIHGTVNQNADKDLGWSLELAIPWSNFSDMAKVLPPAFGSTWTANLNRWDGTPPDRRLSQWSPSGDPRPNPHVPARFGRLTFVQ